MNDMEKREVLLGIYKRGLSDCPWLSDVPSDEKDVMAEKLSYQVLDFLAERQRNGATL